VTVRVFYATHSTGSYREGDVVLFDDTIPQELGLSQTGYFEQIKTPETIDDPEGPDRTG
jgi:hypothetical protein